MLGCSSEVLPLGLSTDKRATSLSQAAILSLSSWLHANAGLTVDCSPSNSLIHIKSLNAVNSLHVSNQEYEEEFSLPSRVRMLVGEKHGEMVKNVLF